ncbi:MAG: TIGR03790 family protein [Thermodesulfobacteriota bacterium]|nr:TIGR03790 family protein [Thermodesulfobacteriota bacterium]
MSPADLVVLYNPNMKASREVAEHYAKMRDVPLDHLLGVDVTTSEKMQRSEYDEKLVPPLRTMVEQLRHKGRDPAVLLVYGIPLTVARPWGKRPHKDFAQLAHTKAEEFRSLALQLIGELDLLTERTDLSQTRDDLLKETWTTQEIVTMAGESFSRGLQYLKEKETDKGHRERRLKVSSTLIRLAGTSMAAKAVAGRMHKEGKSKEELYETQELLKWDAILRRQITTRSFRGTLPEGALETATIIRFTDGVLGELTYWEDLKGAYNDNRASASVDSELTLAAAGPYQRVGWLPNPFHAKYEDVAFLEAIRAQTIKVARLDGPTPRLAKRLVDDAMATEKEGLTGIFYIDARGLADSGPQDSYAQYDKRLLNLFAMLKEKASMEVVLDKGPELFSLGACPNAALYCGWYSLGKYVDAFTWQKGAVGFHVASAEATTLRTFGSDVWCKRMIENGIAATLGPVKEPYLASFPQPDLFFSLLMSGRIPLLEVYFRTIPHLSWRQILIGDPLYRPFKNNPAISSPYKKKDRAME